MLSTTLIILASGLSLATAQSSSAPSASASSGTGNGGNTLTAKAHVVGGNGSIEANFSFTYVPGQGTQVTVDVLKGLTNTTQGYLYHIHTNALPPNGNCTKALGHLDPLHVTDSFTCDPAFPYYCQEGDLSGKHGTLNGTADGSISGIKYVDDYVRFYPQPFSILGRSVVIHLHNLTRIACGNITSQLDGTEDANGNPTNQSSNYQLVYPSAAAAAQPTVTPFVGTSTDSAVLANATLPASLPDVADEPLIFLSTSTVNTVIGGNSIAVDLPVPVPSSSSFSYTSGATLPTQSVAPPPPNPSTSSNSGGSGGSGSGSASPSGKAAGKAFSVSGVTAVLGLVAAFMAFA